MKLDDKLFDPNKNYRIGKLRAGSSKQMLKWSVKPQPKVIDGYYLINTCNCKSARDFWTKNPFNETKLNSPFVLAEVDASGEDIYFAEGMFMNPGQGLAGVASPILNDPTPSGSAAAERVLNDQLQHERERAAQLQTALAQKDAEREELIKAHQKEVANLNNKILERDKELTDLKFDLRVAQAIEGKTKEALEQKGLSDNLGMLSVITAPFQAAIANKLVDKLGDKAVSIIEKFAGGGSSAQANSVNNAEFPDQVGTADDLPIRGV